ncbi:MAG: hypothetical protein AAGM67_20700, partial [Bacteroidota bacterium]
MDIPGRAETANLRISCGIFFSIGASNSPLDALDSFVVENESLEVANVAALSLTEFYSRMVEDFLFSDIWRIRVRSAKVMSWFTCRFYPKQKSLEAPTTNEQESHKHEEDLLKLHWDSFKCRRKNHVAGAENKGFCKFSDPNSHILGLFCCFQDPVWVIRHAAVLGIQEYLLYFLSQRRIPAQDVVTRLACWGV